MLCLIGDTLICAIFFAKIIFQLSKSNPLCLFFFFFNDPAPPEFSPFSLPDAFPICLDHGRQQLAHRARRLFAGGLSAADEVRHRQERAEIVRGMSPFRSQPGIVEVKPADERAKDRKSTRLNSSHGYISYAVFCLKKK